MKLFAALMIFAIVCLMLNGVFESGAGPASTYLTANVSGVAVVIPVQSTDGFLRSDYLVIGDERVRYTSKTATAFTIPATNGRGYDDTEATVHSAGARVYNEGADIINAALGFNVTTSESSGGVWSFITNIFNFITVTIPRLLLWNYSYFQINAWTGMLRWIFLALSAAYTFWLATLILQARRV